MNITITGTITSIFKEEVYGNFSKRIFWVKEDAEKYPNHYELQMNGEKCNVLNNYASGDKIICTADVKGRHYEKNGKEGCINSLVVWKIEKVADTQQQKREANRNFYQSVHQSDDRTNPLINAARGRDANGTNNDEIDSLPF